MNLTELLQCNIKEVLHGRIHELLNLVNNIKNGQYSIEDICKRQIRLALQLQVREEKAKSINDIREESYREGWNDCADLYKRADDSALKEAFEAGRKVYVSDIIDVWEYLTFEDYLKTITIEK